jgi:hypothetical protein
MARPPALLFEELRQARDVAPPGREVDDVRRALIERLLPGRTNFRYAQVRSEGPGVAIIAAMKTRSLDILGKSQLPPAQAHAILKVMEMEIAAGHETLASKLDLLEVKSELTSQLNRVEGKLSRWVLTCVLTCILGQTAVLAGLGYFVLEHFRR